MKEHGLLDRLARARNLPLWVVLAGLLVSLPALSVGLYADDIVHRALVTGAVPNLLREPTELYDFISSDPAERALMRDLGGLPWWSDPGLVIRFFRPLPSLLLVGEARILGDALWVARLHTFLWFGLLLVIATALLRRFLSPRAAAAAALVYALSIVHATAVAWLAARYSLMVAVFGLASLWLHVRAREDQWRPGVYLAPLLLVVAFLCGECALGAAGANLFYELLAAPGRLSQRLAAILPAAAITLGYLGYYEAAGYGAQNSAIYVDPLTDPARFLALASVRVPALAGNLLAAVPTEIGFAEPAARPALAVIGLVAMAVAFVTAWPLRTRMGSRERWAVLWMVAMAGAAVIVSAGGVLGGRVLLLAMLGASALLGSVLAHAWSAGSSLGRLSAFALRAAAVTFFLLHFVVSPLLRVGVTLGVARTSRATGQIASNMAQPCASRVYLLAASDPAVFFYAPLAALLDGKTAPKSFRVVSMAPQAHRIENVRPAGFDLVVVGQRRAGAWERLFRRTPLRAGDEATLPGLSLRVEEVHGGWPARLRLDFPEPLASSKVCFLHYRDGALRELDPLGVGQTIELPRELGPGRM